MYKTSDYEKWFNVVSKYFKETGKPTKYDQFDVMIGKLIVESGATFNATCSMNKEIEKAEFKVVKKTDKTHEKTA